MGDPLFYDDDGVTYCSAHGRYQCPECERIATLEADLAAAREAQRVLREAAETFYVAVRQRANCEPQGGAEWLRAHDDFLVASHALSRTLWPMAAGASAGESGEEGADRGMTWREPVVIYGRRGKCGTCGHEWEVNTGGGGGGHWCKEQANG